jgi:DNA-directed RNA polymerase specialized sigma24 family protein
MLFGESSIPDDPDLILELWLAEKEGTVQERSLLNELAKTSETCIRRIVPKKLSASGWGSARKEDIDDVCQSAQSKILHELRKRQAEPSRGGKIEFLPYVAQTARNTCYEMIRRKNPVWVSFATRVRRRATKRPEFALWDCGDAREVCGFQQDRGAQAGRDLERIARAKSELLQAKDPRKLSIEELMREILTAAGTPLIFEVLVDLVMDWNGMKGIRETALTEEVAPNVALGETLPDHGPNQEQQMSDTELMRWLWNEICALLPEHRTVVLLNLRDTAGGRIQLFPLLGIASFSEIADALGMDRRVFAELSRRLPLNDAEIAAILKIDTGHVSDRRNSARLRLARRMRKFLEEK